MAALPPFDRQAIEDSVYDWFSSATGLETFWQNQKKVQPIHPFATLRNQSLRRVGGEDELRYETPEFPDPGDETRTLTVGLRVMVVTCEVFGAGAQSLLEAAQAALSTPSVATTLKQGGIAVIDEGTILRLDQLESDDWTERASMDVVFCVASNVIESTGQISTVEISSDQLGLDEEEFQVSE